jgi:hypothetical protein
MFAPKFVRTVNYILGTSLFVSFNRTIFLPVFLFGNGNGILSYVWSMEIYCGRLYIGTFGRPNLRGIIDFPVNLDIDLQNIPDSMEGINLQEFQ